MAVLRNGVALLVALVAAAFLASAVSADAGCDCSAAAQSSDCSWNCYAAAEGARQASHQPSQGIESVDGTVTTSALPARGYTITVDKWGKGNFWNIQDAINSIPNGNTERVIIKINDGVYRYWLAS
jgi:pectin methylesterase-like acyl-CoA thioesterase